MTIPLHPDELDATRLAAAVPRDQVEPRPARPERPWPEGWPTYGPSGSDPTSPPVEMDPTRLAALIPR